MKSVSTSINWKKLWMIQNGLCQNSENSCLYINLNKYVYLNHRNSFYDGFFFVVCPAWAITLGCKSRTRLYRGKRSEDRRVGKERRRRSAAYQWKKEIDRF